MRLVLFSAAWTLGSALSAQMVVSQAMTPQQLVNDVLLGGGVTASNITYNGALGSAGQQGHGTFAYTGTALGLEGGVILMAGDVNNAPDPPNNLASDPINTGADPDLADIANANINDRSIIEFDFIPTGDTLRFRYVFASEEYPDFVCSGFNDAFGFFLSGPGIAGPFTNGAVNLALIPNTNIPVTINTVNSGVPGSAATAPPGSACAAQDPSWQSNSVYFVDNSGGTDVVFNGFTVVLTAFAEVVCGQTYRIKLAVGDAGDTALDSGVFLEEGSFTSTGQVQTYLMDAPGVVGGNTMLRGCGPYEIVFQRLGDLSDPAVIQIFIAGDAVPGVDYSPALPTELNYAAGQEFLSVFIDVPYSQAPTVTLEILIEQIIQCAGVVLMTLYEFDLSPPPLLEVTSEDINSSCGQSHVLAPEVTGGPGQYTYVWSTGETSPSITVSPGVTTTYSVTVGDICQVPPITVDFTVDLPVYPPLTMEVSPPTAIECLGNDDISVLSVTGGNDVYTYEWTLDGSVLGTTPTINVPAGPPTWYVVTATDGCGSTITDSVLVSTIPLPPIELTTTGDVTVICPGDTTLLEVVNITGGNGVYTLSWTNAAGQVLSTTSQLEVGVPVDATYTITVSDQCGTEAVASVTTFLPVYAPLQLNVPASRTICAGDSLLLHAAVTGGSGYYFVDWQGLGLTDPMIWVAPLEDTEYTVTVTDQCGASLTRSLDIGVEHVEVEIVVTNYGQDDWYLQAATIPYAQTWLWDMGDGTRYRGPEVYHSYYNTDDHWAYLWITTPNGCQGMDSVFLEVPAHLYFPNAFTPDGDGVNDLFGPVGHGISDFEMIIFDRWGQEVFRTADTDIRWDGRVNGSDQPVTGVYVYKYRAEGHYFPSTEGYGHVTLVR